MRQISREDKDGRVQGHAHRMVAETAAQMAFEVYEELAKRNDWYHMWKTSHPGMVEPALGKTFVRQVGDQYLVPARAILAGQLATPIDDDLKERIMEALTLDNTLMRGRGRGH